MNFRKIILSMTLISVSMLGISAQALQLNTVEKITIFGDSLSDVGYMNNTPEGFLPAGKRPTYTTPRGHVWPYYFSRNLAQGGINPNTRTLFDSNDSYVSRGGSSSGRDFAAGAATTDKNITMFDNHYTAPKAIRQVDYYLDSVRQKAKPNELYIIWIGVNNIGYAALTSLDPKKVVAATQTAIHDNLTMVKKLHDAGAKHILIIGMFDIGKLPTITQIPVIGDKKIVSDTVSSVATWYNAQLKDELAMLRDSAGNKIPVMFYNPEGIMDTIVNDVNEKGSYTLDNLMINNVKGVQCSGGALASLQCENQTPDSEHYMFADMVHPSDVMHRIFAKKLEQYLATTKD
jgi:phospholipase/lecithinase/hemolysin